MSAGSAHVVPGTLTSQAPGRLPIGRHRGAKAGLSYVRPAGDSPRVAKGCGGRTLGEEIVDSSQTAGFSCVRGCWGGSLGRSWVAL